jgi:CRISPR-associated protein Cas2
MNSHRAMRLMLFFDLPIVTDANRRDYSRFVKNLKKSGFYMLQESVYVKLDMDERSSKSSENEVRKFLPDDGDIAVLMVTEKQFASIEFLLGDSASDVVSDDKRMVVL